MTPGIVRALARVPARRRRGIRLEHVRVAGRDRVVPPARRARTSCSSRATISARARAGGAPSRVRRAACACAVLPACSRSERRHESRSSNEARSRERVRIFANTIDVRRVGVSGRASLHSGVPSCGRSSALAADDVVVLSRRATRAGEGARTFWSAQSRRPAIRGFAVVVAGDGPELARSTAARAGARRTPATDAVTSRRGGARRGVRRPPTSSRCSRRHETWGVVVNEAAASGFAACALGPSRCGARSAPRRRERFPRSGAGTSLRRRRRSSVLPRMRSCAARPASVARARPRVGLRAVGRELRRGRARSDVAVDLLLHVGDVVPRRASRGGDAAARRAAHEAASSERTLPNRVDDRVAARRERRAPRRPRRSRRCRSGRRRSTGVPAAAASAATMPKLSPAEARTKTSACG